MQRIAYNQVANKYTLMRDDIQPKRLMIYQACDLDKKSHLERCDFLVETQRLALWSYTFHKSFLHTYPSVNFSGRLG